MRAQYQTELGYLGIGFSIDDTAQIFDVEVSDWEGW